ncbi:MAG: hypothetical protein AB8F65_15140 [Woeseiaceae bacterium]
MINDEQLTLYFYEDGLTKEQREQVTHALATDSALQQRYESLQKDLSEMAVMTMEPAPEHLKHQWHDVVSTAARQEQRAVAAPSRGWPRFAWIGTAAGLFIAFAIGTQFDNVSDEKTAPPPVASLQPTEAQPTDAFARGLQVHLQGVSNGLGEFDGQDSPGRTDLINQIIAQNRVFEAAAESRDARDIARLMRALQPVFFQLADDNLSPREADALRLQLMFELNAVLTKLELSTSDVRETI